MNRAIAELVRSRVTGAIAEAMALSAVHHHGFKGQLRELVAGGMLRPLLPPAFGIGSGEVVTAYDQHSQQTDIVIYDRSIVPPSLVGDAVGLFPIEATIACIEVKSQLTREGLKLSSESAAALQYLHFVPDPTGHNRIPTSPLKALFAFNSDMAVGDELERLRSVQPDGSPGLEQFCIVGKGNWFRSGSGWTKVQSSGEHGEILSFLATVINRLPHFSASRWAPDLLDYYGVQHRDVRVVPQGESISMRSPDS